MGATDKKHLEAYRQLFEQPVAAREISEIREAANKAWVLGNDRFKQGIQEKLKRRVEPRARGGDRRSEQFRINRVWPYRFFFVLVLVLLVSRPVVALSLSSRYGGGQIKTR